MSAVVNDLKVCDTCRWANFDRGDTGPEPISEVEKAVAATIPDNIVLGQCRRHAPTSTGYPVVSLTGWCGDHTVKN